jgi:predicted DNA-binding transcriptional regulator AlpA
MNKDEAAAYLGISTRTLERYTSKGSLQVKYEGTNNRPIAIYEQEDLDRLKSDLVTPLVKPKIEDDNLPATIPDNQNKSLSVVVGAMGEEQQNPLERLVAALSAVPVADKLLLTLPEVQALTGLSRGILKEAIKAGDLKAKIIGKSYRCKRGDVESFISKI